MRLQFNVTKEQDKKIKELMEKTGSPTKKDLFNNALSVFQWALNQVLEGRVIGSIDKDGNNYRELSTPSFDHAATLKDH